MSNSERDVARSRSLARRGVAAVAWAAALLLATCLPASPGVASEDPCPNEVRRAEQSSTYLPNCRAYEQVTPTDKNAAEPQPVNENPFEPTAGAFAAFDGGRVAWITEYPGLSGQDSASFGLDYLSTRGAEGWSTENMVPPQSPSAGKYCPEDPGMVGWSSNLERGILADGASQEFSSSYTPGFESFSNQSSGCDHPEPALREADGAEIKEPAGFQNLFLRDNETGSYRLVNITPITAPHPTPSGKISFQVYEPPDYLAGSASLGTVAFEDELPLTEEAEKLSPEVEAACKEEPKSRACWEGHDELYVWNEDKQPAVRLVTILPEGEPTEGILAGSTRTFVENGNLYHPTNIADYRHAVSADGSRIFFEADGNLYVRENAGQPQSALGKKGECTESAKACTIELDLPQGAMGTGGGGRWVGANAEGTKVFFTDGASAGLTSTTVEGSGANLYEYELPSKPGVSGTLTDLTPAANAEVLGMSGVSEDGSYVYFVARGKLTAAGKVVGRSPEESEPAEGADNLYVSHEGSTTFIATLGEKDLCDWASNMGCALNEPGTPRETGLTARVSGNGRYLAFNSVSQLTGYDSSGSSCIEEGRSVYVAGSCEEIFLYEAEANYLACVSCDPGRSPSAQGATIDYPAGVDRSAGILTNTYPQRNVSEAGQVFFETAEALLPTQDTNGVRDVYEYEGGVLYLVSSGTSAAPSHFLDASASGSDVFFATAQKLVGWDADSVYDIYDARVDGGFPERSPPAPTCESETCKGAQGVSAAFSTPSSVTFAGPGNIAQTNTAEKAQQKGSADQRRRAELRRALKRCERRHRRNRAKRRGCERRARRGASRKAKGGDR